MLPSDLSGGIESIAHVVQVALTPVFLLSGIGTLLGMFNLRQNHIADRTEHLAELADAEQDEGKLLLLQAHLARLYRRRVALDAAVLLGAVGGACTCGAAFVLFLGGLRNAEVATALVLLFGAALACTVGALTAFLADGVLAWHGLQREGPMPRSKLG